MDEENFGELELEETKFRTLTAVKGGVDTLVLTNESGREPDADALADWLASVPGIEAITSLVVTPSSRLEHLMLVRGLPNLMNIQINGSRLRSLEGLESFRNGRYADIDTGKNRRRNIAAIAKAPITKLRLQYATPGDFDVIAMSLTLRDLELGASPQPPLERWVRLPLESLSCSKGTFSELTDTAKVPTLKSLVLTNCRKLEALTGDNGGVTWLVIQGCGRLDLNTVASFVQLESLSIVGRRDELALSALGRLTRLESLFLEGRKVTVDVGNLRTSMPQLTSLCITRLKWERALELSRANPGVSIATGSITYRDGVRMN
jgi:Leucine-rich repeat (LRR) protein